MFEKKWLSEPKFGLFEQKKNVSFRKERNERNAFKLQRDRRISWLILLMFKNYKAIISSLSYTIDSFIPQTSNKNNNKKGIYHICISKLTLDWTVFIFVVPMAIFLARMTKIWLRKLRQFSKSELFWIFFLNLFHIERIRMVFQEPVTFLIIWEIWMQIPSLTGSNITLNYFLISDSVETFTFFIISLMNQLINGKFPTNPKSPLHNDDSSNGNKLFCSGQISNTFLIRCRIHHFINKYVEIENYDSLIVYIDIRDQGELLFPIISISVSRCCPRLIADEMAEQIPPWTQWFILVNSRARKLIRKEIPHRHTRLYIFGRKHIKGLSLHSSFVIDDTLVEH